MISGKGLRVTQRPYSSWPILNVDIVQRDKLMEMRKKERKKENTSKSFFLWFLFFNQPNRLKAIGLENACAVLSHSKLHCLRVIEQVRLNSLHPSSQCISSDDQFLYLVCNNILSHYCYKTSSNLQGMAWWVLLTSPLCLEAIPDPRAHSNIRTLRTPSPLSPCCTW